MKISQVNYLKLKIDVGGNVRTGKARSIDRLAQY